MTRSQAYPRVGGDAQRGGGALRIGAVWRLRCRDVPPLAAALRSLEPIPLIFLGFGFSLRSWGSHVRVVPGAPQILDHCSGY